MECGRCAPLRNQKMARNAVVEYEYYIILGTVPEIQAEVYRLKKDPLGPF